MRVRVWLAVASAVAATMVFGSTRAAVADPPTDVTQLSVEWPRAVAVARDGSVLVAGRATESLPATDGAYDTTLNGAGDTFVMKVDATGRVLWVTYFGGPSSEDATAVTEGPDGSVYLVGITGRAFDDAGNDLGPLPTTPGALSEDYDRPDSMGLGWVAKLSADGANLDWATIVPGSGLVEGVDVDTDGRVYLAGTAWDDLPVTNDAFDTTYGGGAAEEGFVAVLSDDGSTLEHASFFGGSGRERISNLTLGPQGSVYLAGDTNSPDLPGTSGSFAETLGGSQDALVARVDNNFALDWATYVGGSTGSGEAIRGLDVGTDGTAVISGVYSWHEYPTTDFPVTNGAPWGSPPAGEVSGWAAAVSAGGERLEWATYTPGGVQSVHLDRQGHAHMVTLGAAPGTIIEGGAPYTVALELDRQGALRSATPANPQPVLVSDADPAGSMYLVGFPGAPVRTATKAPQATSTASLTRLARCTVEGTPGDDVLVGTNGPDVICAGAGSDVVEAGDGYDIVIGGRGDDEVYADAGVDVVRAGSGADTVYGNADRDLLVGGAGPDVLYGGGGPDTLVGGRGRDVVRGGPGRDEDRV